MADERKYLEGNYDGEPVQQAVQMAADVVRAVNMPKEIRAVQEAVYEKETERLSYEEKATGEKFEELMRNYIEEDKYHQYLVDGAVLRCTAATTDDFTYAEGETVVSENKDDEVCNITLDVHENPMSVNHLIYATVKDTVQQINITPPKCNCRLAVNRNAERKRIIDDMERNKNGVCRHLMDLNDTWDNFEVDGTTYLKKVNAVINLFLSEDGKGIVEGPGDIIGEEDGITMTSVLFCKHGGLIMPVTSGQENFQLTQETTSEIIPEEIENVKKEILLLINKENGVELVKNYLDEIRATNPDYVQFLNILATRESQGSGDYKAISGTHLGRYQIGNDTFIQIGFKNDALEWTDLAKSFGVGVGNKGEESFLNNETAQEVAILFALRWDYQQIVSYGDNKMIGTRIGDENVEVTSSGLIAAGHLVGTGSLHKGFTGEKSWKDIYDGNKTKATTYMDEMGGLDLSGILGGIQ